MPVTTHHGFSTLPAQTLPFLSLPAEIRRMIYAELMTSHHLPLLAKDSRHHPILYRRTFSDAIERRIVDNRISALSHSLPVALLCTNRQIHAEATHCFYTHVTRRLYVGHNHETRRVWPYKGWPYHARGWIGIEIIMITCPRWAAIGTRNIEKSLGDVVKMMEGSRMRSVFVHAREKRLEEDLCEYRYLTALAVLVGDRKEVVVGVLRDGKDGREEWAYHLMTDASRGGTGKGPYGNVQYERVVSLDFEEGEDRVALWRRFGDRDGGGSALIGGQCFCV